MSKKLTMIVENLPDNFFEDAERGAEITVVGTMLEIEFNYDPDLVDVEIIDE